jgi:hypothetical protein
MTSQDHRRFVERHDAAGVRHVVGQRGQRVLYGDDGQSSALQALDYRRPGRAVGVAPWTSTTLGSGPANS